MSDAARKSAARYLERLSFEELKFLNVKHAIHGAYVAGWIAAKRETATRSTENDKAKNGPE